MIKRFLLGILLLIAFSLSAEESTKDPTHAEWDWVNNNYYATLNELMPIDSDDGETVVFRYSDQRLNGPLEFSVVMLRNYRTNAIQVSFREAVGSSIYSQLMDQHQTAPEKQSSQIRNMIKVNVRLYEDKTCPAIKSLFDKIHKLKFTVPSPYLIIMDPPLYEFRTGSLAGSIDATFVEENNPVVQWAFQTKSALLSCPYKQ